VRDLAIPVLAHRVMPTAEADLRGTTSIELIDAVVAATPVPVETVTAV
jgi:MoxR-like ATPase